MVFFFKRDFGLVCVLMGWLLMLVLASCQSINSPINGTSAGAEATYPTIRVEPTRTILPTITAVPANSNEVALEITGSLKPSATSTPQPSPTKTVPLCPPPQESKVIFSQPTDLDELRQVVIHYLNSGGSYLTLPEQLEAAFARHAYVAEADLNGNGLPELAITIDFFLRDASGEIIDHESVAWVFQCTNSYYDIIYEEPGGMLGLLLNPIQIISLRDDNTEQIIFEWQSGGSATSWQPEMIAWNNGIVVYNFERTPSIDDPLCCVSEWYFQDLDGDGTKEIVVVGDRSFHPEFGLPRQITRTFKLQNERAFEIIASEYAPSEYRHQVISDAQSAFEAGDFDLATQLFAQAAYDNNLGSVIPRNLQFQDEIEPFPKEYQSAFALFRLIAIQLILEENQDAHETLENIQRIFPEGQPAGEFSVLADLLYRAIVDGSTPVEACEQITEVITTTFPNLRYHIGFWGYLDAVFDNETICPFHD
jgi:hypothetical protein